MKKPVEQQPVSGTPLFDAAESRARKEEGMELAADHKQTALEVARGIAVEIARAGDGTCDADQVGARMTALGFETGPWAGSIFKGDGWIFTGNRRESTRKSNHARELKIWRRLQDSPIE